MAIQPFPVVTHPVKNELQSVSEVSEFEASVHIFKAQFVPDPNLQYPSLPFINGQVASVPVKLLQVCKEAVQPYPVVTQPAENASHAV